MKLSNTYIILSLVALAVLSSFRFSEPRFDPNQVIFRFVQRVQTFNMGYDYDEFVFDNIRTEAQTRLFLWSDKTFLWKHNVCMGASLSSGYYSISGDTLLLSSDSTMTQNYFEDYTSNKQVNWHIKPSMFQKKFFIERNSETAEMKNLVLVR